MTLSESKIDHDSNSLFDKCLEYSIDHEFVMKILWHRIYQEPIVMKFISMRHSNYANNLLFGDATNTGTAASTSAIGGYFLVNDTIPVFPLY